LLRGYFLATLGGKRRDAKMLLGLFIGMHFDLLGFGPFITVGSFFFFFLQKENGNVLYIIFYFLKKLNLRTSSPC
jgi:hypothetical protein